MCVKRFLMSYICKIFARFCIYMVTWSKDMLSLHKKLVPSGFKNELPAVNVLQIYDIYFFQIDNDMQDLFA